MGSWPAPGKVFFCVLIFVAVFVAGYFYFVTEDIEVLDQAKIAEADLRTNFESKAFSVSNQTLIVPSLKKWKKPLVRY